jgi:hypothetical protein
LANINIFFEVKFLQQIKGIVLMKFENQRKIMTTKEFLQGFVSNAMDVC